MINGSVVLISRTAEQRRDSTHPPKPIRPLYKVASGDALYAIAAQIRMNERENSNERKSSANIQIAWFLTVYAPNETSAKTIGPVEVVPPLYGALSYGHRRKEITNIHYTYT